MLHHRLQRPLEEPSERPEETHTEGEEQQTQELLKLEDYVLRSRLGSNQVIRPKCKQQLTLGPACLKFTRYS